MCCKMIDSKVLDNQKGYNRFSILFFIGIATTMSRFGAATTDLWTDKAGGCIGTESRLYSCPAYPGDVSCTSANPAAVMCSSPCKDKNMILAMGL